METILKTGYWKVVGLFYKEPSAKFHLREIARKTKLNENSATRFLRKMEEEGILKSEREGNLLKYGIKKNKKVFLLFSLFDEEKLSRLPLLRRNAVLYFHQALEEKPIIMVVFGSTAKETYQSGSDIDLLLIVNKKINTKNAEHYVEAQAAMSISCFQMTYPDFLKEIKLKEDKVIASALATGYPVTNNVLYYQEVLA